MADRIADAQAYLQREGLDGWLVYDHRRSNPVFYDLVGDVSGLTRPVFYLVPAHGAPRLLAHAVDAGKLAAVPGGRAVFAARASFLAALRALLSGKDRLAMEYVPDAALPLSSRVDAGTVELLRSLGVREIVSSADLVQEAMARWSPAQLQSHRWAARTLTDIVHEGVRHVGERLRTGLPLDEHGLHLYLRRLMDRAGLDAPDGPIVAVNAHTADPHYEPTLAMTTAIRPADWLLIDIWARGRGPHDVFADITWVAFLGDQPPSEYRRVFETVVAARDAAVDALRRAHREGTPLRGFEADAVARKVVAGAGYADYFTHRLGHSIGRDVHGNGANLDGWETHDVRRLIQGTGFSVEPGVYLPGRFGVRSEIDVYLAPDGPEVTTPPQTEIVLVEV